MKTHKYVVVCLLSLIGFSGSFAQAQAPASLSGTTLFQTATAAASPFDYPNYGLVFFANSGNTFSSGGIMDGSVGSPTSGTYGYVPSGADGLFSATNHVGSFTGDYTYNNADSGSYVLNQSSSGGFQDGTFTMYAGQAPASLAGLIFTGQETDGAGQGVTSFPVSLGLTFTASSFVGTGGAGNGSSQPYSYSLINRSTGKFIVNKNPEDFAYIFFNSPTSCGFAQHDHFGGWSVGYLNIQDTTPPTLSITSPKTGANWSNDVYTVTGTASDKLAVSNVLVSVNGGAWTTASLTGNNWTNEVNLIPGTNSISAYAVDDSGNGSPTTTVKLVYIVTSRLVVNVVGDGTLKQNLNGASLVVGKNYSMKATPAKGFGFYFWNVGAAMSNSPTLVFEMSEGLSITANFNDITPPKVTITSPKANSKESNATITVTGTATDNVAVTNIGVRVNDGPWVDVSAAGASVNWSVTDVPVAAGTNVLQAYAMDAAGNISKTNTVKFIGELPPTSLAGYAATATITGQAQKIDLTWGDTTWAQTGTSGDTNAGDYVAGDYTYFQTSPTTALLTNMDVGMMSALGVTNVTTVYLTYTSANNASFDWTNDNGSGSGTMVLTHASDLVPVTLVGKTLKLNASGGGPTLTFASDGTFARTQGSNSSTGTYTFIQYSPTVGIIVQNYTDVSEAGALGYIELNFTSTTAGNGFGCYYQTPAYGNNPDDSGVGSFTLK